MIKFSQHGTKESVFRCAREKKPNGLFMSENLTPTRATILFSLRQAKRRHADKVNGCGSVNGRVFVWMNPPEPSGRRLRIFINSMDKLNTFLFETLGERADQLNIGQNSA